MSDKKHSNNKHDENIHSEHRKRVRKELLAHGFDIETPPHKILEMLLFYSIPRKDTNEIAHELINKFGSIEAVLKARPEELVKISGVGENTVAQFKLILTIVQRFLEDRQAKVKKFGNAEEVYQYLLGKYFNCNKEMIGITSLNNNGKLLGFDVVGEGDIASVGVSIREIVEIVIKRNATSVILSHNHPGASALPSLEDIVATERLYKALADMRVILLDHIIIAENDFVSFNQTEQLKYIFKHLESK